MQNICEYANDETITDRVAAHKTDYKVVSL